MEYLFKAAIDSVLSQSFQDFELLIIDDGSTDNSKEIIEDYRAVATGSLSYINRIKD